MTIGTANLGDLTSIRTGKLDANASSEDGEYPFFTCAREPLRISSYSYDCECVLIAGNGDLNAKYYQGKFDAYQRTYIVEARSELEDQLHIRYVYHFLEDYLVTLREQSIGGIIKYIKLGNLTGAKIPLPTFAEQKRIAAILDAADTVSRDKDAFTVIRIAANLGDLTSIRTGKLDANASSEDGEYPFFTCAREPLRISSYSYDCECVLIAGNGDLNAKYYQGKFDAYQRTYIVEARSELEDQLHIRYVYHFLEDYLVTLREQSIGGIIKYIKLGNLTGAKIPLPTFAEQKRIAAILDAADTLRVKRRESLVQLDTLLQSTFLDLFGDPVRNPMGWKTYKIGEVGEVITGNTPSRKRPEYYGDDIEWIKSDNINDPSFFLTEAAERISVAGKKVARTTPKGSLLVTCIAGSRSCIGNAAIANREVAFNQQINAFVPSERINIWFAFGTLWVGKRLVQSASTNSMKGMHFERVVCRAEADRGDSGCGGHLAGQAP